MRYGKLKFSGNLGGIKMHISSSIIYIQSVLRFHCVILSILVHIDNILLFEDSFLKTKREDKSSDPSTLHIIDK